MSTPPHPAQWIVFALLILVAQLAAALGRRRYDHRPFATAMGVVLVADAVRWWLRGLLDGVEVAGGWPRVAFHAEEALYLLWPAAIAWCALRTLTRVRARWTDRWGLGCWLLAATLPILFFSSLRGPHLAAYYLYWQSAALLTLAVSLARWAGRGGLFHPAPAAVCLAILGACETVSLVAGAWPAGLFGEAYGLEHAVLVVAYVSIATVQLAALRSPA